MDSCSWKDWLLIETLYMDSGKCSVVTSLADIARMHSGAHLGHFLVAQKPHLRLKFISILMNTVIINKNSLYNSCICLCHCTHTHAHTLMSHIHTHTSHRMCSTSFSNGYVWTWRSPLNCLGFFSSTCTAMNPTGCRGDTLYRYCVHASKESSC